MGHHPEPKVMISDKIPESLAKRMRIFQVSKALVLPLRSGLVEKLIRMEELGPILVIFPSV